MFAKPRHAPDTPFRAGAFPGRNRRSRRTAGFCVSMQERSPPRRNARTMHCAQRPRTHAPRILMHSRASLRIPPRHFSFSSAAFARRILCASAARSSLGRMSRALSCILAHPCASLRVTSASPAPPWPVGRSARPQRAALSDACPAHPHAFPHIRAFPPRHFSFSSAAFARRTLCAYHAQRAVLSDACPAHPHAFPHIRAFPPRHFSFSSAAFARRTLCASASAS